VTKVTYKKRSEKTSGSLPYKFIFYNFPSSLDSLLIVSLFRPYATIPFAESVLELDLTLLANVSAHDAQVPGTGMCLRKVIFSLILAVGLIF
jgi:hypothetical protein